METKTKKKFPAELVGFGEDIQSEIKSTIEIIEMKMIASIDKPPVGCYKPSDIYKVEINKLILKLFNHEKWIELQHYHDCTKGLNATDYSVSKLSIEIVNRINKEFNLKLKTIESSQMDEFIWNYLKTIMFNM